MCSNFNFGSFNVQWLLCIYKQNNVISKLIKSYCCGESYQDALYAVPRNLCCTFWRFLIMKIINTNEKYNGN